MRIFLIVAALVVALIASVMTARYLRHSATSSESLATVEILVSASDLGIGQTVVERNLKWQSWPKKSLNPRYLIKQNHPDAVKKFSGATVRQPLSVDEPITESKIVKRDGSSILSVLLQEGRRAVTIKVTEDQGVAGLVRPGDLVDVLLTRRVTTPTDIDQRAERTVSEVIARGVRVLASGQEVSSEDEKSKLAKSITVEVTPQQAEAISIGRTIGTLSLALRSAFSENDERVARTFTSDDDLLGVRGGNQDRGLKILSVSRTLVPHTLLNEADLTWIDAPENVSLDLYVLEEGNTSKSFQGSLLMVEGVPGQPLERKDIVRPSDGRFVPMALRPGFRAISVTIAQNTAVGGFISPGDLVDIIYTDEISSDSSSAGLKQRSWSETVAIAVRVLSIETGLDPKTQLPTVGGTATLEATPEQARKIALAAAMGQLTLALRSMSEQTPLETPVSVGSESVFTPDIDMSQGLRRLVRPETRTGTTTQGGVTVIRGTQRSTVPTSNSDSTSEDKSK